MGSSFSVVNTTNKPIWVSHGISNAALYGSICGVLSLVACAMLGVGIVAFVTRAAAISTDSLVVALLEAEGLVTATEEATTISAEGWSYLCTVTGLLDAGTGITANLVGNERDKVMSAKQKLQEHTTRPQTKSNFLIWETVYSLGKKTFPSHDNFFYQK